MRTQNAHLDFRKSSVRVAQSDALPCFIAKSQKTNMTNFNIHKNAT